MPNKSVLWKRPESIDAGDFYIAADGKRPLYRMAGNLALRLDEASRRRSGHSISISGRDEYQIRFATPLQWDIYGRVAGKEGAPELAEALRAARKSTDVRAANPVFIDPESGLWMVITEDIIIRLQPDTDPKAYFGQQWPSVKRVTGTTDQFVLRLETTAAEEVLTEVNRRAADPKVLWAEPDFVTEEIRHENDPLFANQWYLNNTGQSGGRTDADLDASEAWQITKGSDQVVIGVIDDGVDVSHPDLSPNIFANPGEVAGNGVDDDLNGYVDDVRGWDFASGDNDPGPLYADDSHGTATAGVAAAAGNNGLGIAGMAYGCKILPIRIYGATASGRAAALYYAGGRTRDGQGRWRGADVLSISLGWPKSQVDFDAMKWTAKNGRGGKGCPIFVATGNFGSGWYILNVSNIAAGTHTFRFEYIKDGSVSAGQDTVWLDDIVFPGGARGSFEGNFPPAGWTTGGAAQWSQETRHDHVRGTGIRSARSGRISHNQATYMQVTRAVDAGTLSLWSWTSTERVFDVLNVYVDGVLVATDPGGVNSWRNGVVSYPATHPDAVGVGASTDFDYRADYSQFGPGLDVLAPSSGGIGYILTPDRPGAAGYSPDEYNLRFGGTSAACPLAAGVGALLLSVNPCLSGSEVVKLIQNSCDKIGGVTYNQGYNTYYGYGRVNAARALTNTQPYNPTLSLAAWDATSAAATTNVTVSVMGAGCTWYVSNLCSWVVPSRTSGKGAGPVTLSLRPNADCIPRVCVLTIAGQPLTINQGASPGVFSLSPTNWTAPWNGGSKTVNLRPAGAGCSWEVVNPCSEWLEVNPSSGTDTGVVAIVATSNLTSFTRSCDLVIAGKRFRVVQGPAAVVSFGRAVYTNRESDRTAVVRVVRNGAVNRSVTVDVVTQDGTATSPDDYHGRTNRLRLAAGITSTNVPITLVNDTVAEDSESFSIIMANPAAAVLGSQNTAVVLLLDNNSIATLDSSSAGHAFGKTVSCSISQLASGECELRLGPANGTIEIQASRDLRQWETVTILRGESGELLWKFVPSSTEKARFYRAVPRGD